MKKLCLFLIIFIPLQDICAQQLPTFIQYRQYSGIINPAAFETEVLLNEGKSQYYVVNGGIRQQWVGNESLSNGTSVVSAMGLFTDVGGRGITILGGAHFISDEIGATGMNGFSMRGALFLGNPDGFQFGLGFSYGITFNSIEIGKLRAQSADDPILNSQRLTSNIPDFSVGLFGVQNLNTSSNDLVYFGVSVPQVFEYELSFASEQNFNFKRVRHIYGLGGIYFDLAQNSEGRTTKFLELSTWFKYVDGIVPQFDINLKYQLSPNFWIGLGGSNSQIFHLETGLIFDIGGNKGTLANGSYSESSSNFVKLGYGFDFPFNPAYGSFVGATHEINLAFYIAR